MDMILSAVRFVQSGSMEDALHILKSGYAPCTVSEGEIFENYVLRYGLFGSSLSAPFSFGEVPEAAETVRAYGLRASVQPAGGDNVCLVLSTDQAEN